MAVANSDLPLTEIQIDNQDWEWDLRVSLAEHEGLAAVFRPEGLVEFSSIPDRFNEDLWNFYRVRCWTRTESERRIRNVGFVIRAIDVDAIPATTLFSVRKSEGHKV